jgi:hypothetical protein
MMKNASTFTRYTIYLYVQRKHSSIFPNVEIAMRILLSMVVKNAGVERSFSKLNL